MHHLYKTILATTQSGMQHLRSLLSPPRCANCKLLLPTYAVFCSICEQKITSIISTRITLSSTYCMSVFAVSAYTDPLKALILAKNRSTITASHQLGELIWKQTHIKNIPIDYCIPVPLHWTRFAYRGYNQAEEIAHILAKHLNKPVIHAFKRIKQTDFQAHLTSLQRLANVKDAFALIGDTSLYHNKHILLVDDLMTTSATLRSIAKLLLPHKPASINAVVACRVV